MGRWDLIEERRVEGISIMGNVEIRPTYGIEETSLAQIEEMFAEVVANYYKHNLGRAKQRGYEKSLKTETFSLAGLAL